MKRGSCARACCALSTESHVDGQCPRGSALQRATIFGGCFISRAGTFPGQSAVHKKSIGNFNERFCSTNQVIRGCTVAVLLGASTPRRPKRSRPAHSGSRLTIAHRSARELTQTISSQGIWSSHVDRVTRSKVKWTRAALLLNCNLWRRRFIGWWQSNTSLSNREHR